MKRRGNGFGRDELRGKFTRFMEVTVKNARRNYDTMLRRQISTVPLESIPESLLAQEDARPRIHPNTFEFEEEKMTRAFQQLSMTQQRVLALLFIGELTPLEAANTLNCSVQHVYNQRSLAIKKLRRILCEEGISHDTDRIP